MNFIIKLSLSKRENIVYNFIFVIINRCTKIIQYISIIVKLDIAKLTKFFFIEIVLIYNMFKKIINNKEFLFINIF